MPRDFRSRFILSGDDQTARAFAGVERSARRTVGAFTKMGLGVAGLGLSIDAVIGKTKQAIRQFDNIAKTADKIGVGTSALQELRHAAELNGIAINTTDMALQRFTRRTAEAAEGTGEAKAVLDQMGIELRDRVTGQLRSTDELLSDVADKLSRVRDQGERVRIAFKLFDSEGVQFVNVLQKGSAELDRMRREARELGIVIDEETLRSAEDLNDQLTVQQKIIDAELNKAFVRLGPAVVKASEAFAGLAGAVGDTVDAFQAFDEVSRTGLEKRIGFVQGQINQLEKSIRGASDGFLIFPQLAEKRLERLQERLDFLNAEQVRRDLIPAFEAFRPKVEAVRDIIGGIRFDRTFFRQLETAAVRVGEVFGIGGPDALGGETDAERREREREEARKRRAAEREAARIESHRREIDRIVEGSEIFRAAQESELEVIRFRTQEEQQILREALENKAIDLEEFNAVRLRIEEDYYARIQELEEDRQRRTEAWFQFQKQTAIMNAADIVSVFGKHFKSLYFLQQASAVTNTVMRTIESVQAALTVPPPMGYVFAAINAAAGAANIASIMATTFGSRNAKPRTGRGGGSASAAPARQALPAPSETLSTMPRGEMVIRIEGMPKTGLLPVEVVRSLMEQISEASVDGFNVRFSG